MTRSVKFTKMQGLGNDFILVDGNEAVNSGLSYSELSKSMCDRKFGIGGDGLIIVNPPEVQSDADISWRIINSDGSEPQMCGNGIRCFAKYVVDKKLVDKKKFSVWTLAGNIIPELLDNDEVRVDMGSPILESAKVPVLTGIDTTVAYPLTIRDREFEFTAVSMGNPHCIIFSEEDTQQLALSYGPDLEKHSLFPEKTNVEFVKVLSNDNIRIDVWERGCGITLACGTGACASVVAAVLNNLTDNTVKADLPGGRLVIEWQRDINKLFMTGKAEYVFTGDYFLS